MTTEPKLTNIDEIGEFGLIDRITNNIQFTNPSTFVGAGDDAAVLEFGDETILVSTDAYAEGVHFDLVYTPLLHLGYKCISASVSDIYAMNGIATQVLISISLSSKFTVEAVDELYKGMGFACKDYAIDIVGGDTTTSRSGLIISVTAIGTAIRDKITYRKGAKKGDLLVVTGDLGGAYIGLQILEREKRVFMDSPQIQPELKGFEYVLKKQLRPESRKDIIDALNALDLIPTAMIDISDGLASEALHICKQSGVGCRIYEEKIPIDTQTFDTALKFSLDPSMCALNGGEDYELLFTLDQSDYETIRNLPDFTVIGHITEEHEEPKLVTKHGNEYRLEAQGWKHF